MKLSAPSLACRAGIFCIALMALVTAACSEPKTISVEQALRAYTVEGAYASFEEDRKGMLKAGMLADMTLIDRVITDIPPQDIRNARVLKTIGDGQVVFSQ